MCIVNALPDKPWNWYHLSANLSVATSENLLKYPNKPWEFTTLDTNPSVPLEFIKKYINKPWSGLFNNEFDYDRDLFKRTFLKNKDEMDEILDN